MPTIRQRKLAQVIVENSQIDKPINKGEMLEKVGYSKHLVKQPNRVIETEGVKEALEELGFTEDNAKRVVSEIMLNDEIDPSARLKATDQVFKVHGSYEADRNGGNNVMILQISGESAQRFKLNEPSRNTEDSSTRPA